MYIKSPKILYSKVVKSFLKHFRKIRILQLLIAFRRIYIYQKMTIRDQLKVWLVTCALCSCCDIPVNFVFSNSNKIQGFFVFVTLILVKFWHGEHDGENVNVKKSFYLVMTCYSDV